MVRAYRSEHENEMQFSPAAPVTSEEDAERWLNQIEARYTGPVMGRHLLSAGAEFRQEGREDSTGADMIWITPVFLSRMNLKFPLRSILQPACATTTIRNSAASFPPRHLSFTAFWMNSGSKHPSAKDSEHHPFQSCCDLLPQQGKVCVHSQPGSEPEESLSYEIGLEGEKAFSGGVTAFRNDIDNMIDTPVHTHRRFRKK